MKNEAQIRRITHYENILDRAEKAVRGLEAAILEFGAVSDGVRELERYYTGKTWRKDHDDDEAGRLPADLKRGVLSEDAVYDLLGGYDRLARIVKDPEAVDE